MIPAGAWTSPSTARNREPILAVLKRHLPASGVVLEIDSGAGEHAVFNATSLPHLQWQPTDPDATARDSIAAWQAHASLPNLLPPLALDASAPETWPIELADAIIAINMVHISPWTATEGLMLGAGSVLPVGGLLFLYGPYIETDVETAPSNLAFNRDLKARNSAWGIRHLNEVKALASTRGLDLIERVAMPANNLMLIFRKS